MNSKDGVRNAESQNRLPRRICIAALQIVLFLYSAFRTPHSAFGAGEPDAFALVGLSARAGGMGNAGVGLADDIESLYYNAAGLGNLVQSGITATYQAPTMETSRGFVAGSWRWKSDRLPGSLGAGWLRLSSRNIELTSTDERVLGEDDLSNDMFLWGAGVHPWSNVSVGLAMKYLRYSFNGFSQSGLGIDAGVHAQWNPFRFGVALTDIGGTVVSGDSVVSGSAKARDKVPMRFKPGVAAIVPEPFQWPITFIADVDLLVKLQGEQDVRVFSGTEIWGFRDRAAFRAGFQEGNGPTFGFGARWLGLQIDYAYLYSFELKDEHRIGTTYRF